MALRSQHELKYLFFVTVLSVLLIPVTVCVATEQIPLEEQLPLHVDILQVLARANQSEEGVDLNALKSLDVNAARVIAETRGKLFLNGLTAITPEVAEVLGTHRGWLHLDGLQSMSPEVATALSKHQGWLFLNGIKVLDKDVALALLPYRGQLYLDSVQTITDEVAEIIAQRRNGVELYGVQDINYQSVAMLRKNSEIILPAKFNRAGWWPF
jgi:hypothetical protein